MVEYKEVDGIYCIILDEDFEEDIKKFREWRKAKELNFLKKIKSTDSLKEALDKVKEDLKDK